MHVLRRALLLQDILVIRKQARCKQVSAQSSLLVKRLSFVFFCVYYCTCRLPCMEAREHGLLLFLLGVSMVIPSLFLIFQY